MRKRSKCAFLATAMAATTILAAGCGNSASGGQNTADSAERVPIRWLTTGDAAAEAIQDNDRIIEAINEKLGIDLTVEIVPEANTEKVNVAMASGDFPDVVTGAYGTSANASITAKQMSEQMDISARKVSRLIKALKENGKIIRVGSDRKGYWKITQ